MSHKDHGFRLNAPQADEEAADTSAPFGGVDVLEIKQTPPQRPVEQPVPSNSSTIVPSVAPMASSVASTDGITKSGRSTAPKIDAEVNERALGLVKYLIAVGVMIVLLLIGLIVTVATVFADDDSSIVYLNTDPPAAAVTDAPTMAPTSPSPAPTVHDMPTVEPKTTLDRIYQRGHLICGVAMSQPGFSEEDLVTGERYGFDVDMCRAVAAAIFGEANDRVEFFPVTAFDRFNRLADDDYDMLSRTTTHTMARHVLEPSTAQGFDFAIPYLYNGLQFAGKPPYVFCADNLTASEGVCQDTKICALDGTTHVDEINAKIPNVQMVSTVSNEFLYSNFIQGRCNVIAGEQFDIAERLVVERGYVGDYEYGLSVHSKEPLAMVTRDDDPQWSDFVNWVMHALLVAEELSITSRTYTIMKTTDLFGPKYTNCFRNAIKTVGNYAEIYVRNLAELLPRPTPDKINEGGSGVIYAFPFGNPLPNGPGPLLGGTIERILERGHLRCGISRRIIFAQFNTTLQAWYGFDVDFCKAVSAALFNGETNNVVYRDLPASERFEALEEEDVDVLSRLTTVTASRDIKEDKTGVGFSFAQPNMYDGLTFGGIPPFGQCADRLDVTSISCRDLLICVNTGTTFEERVYSLFPERFVVPRPSGELSVEGLALGQCNVIAGGVVDVSISSVRGTGYDGPYQTGTSRYSKDPLALVTRQDDNQWSKFVFWIVSGIFHAEEQGITRATAQDMPEVNLFGEQFSDMLRLAVGAVGNYGEIYERQVEADVPRGGLNEGNALLSGPQHYAFPGIA